jgi:hypothetical protein
VIGRRPVIVHGAGCFALLVDGGGQVLEQLLAPLVRFRRQSQHLRVGLLGVGIDGQVERSVRNHRPRGKMQRFAGRRVGLDEPPARGDGRLEALHLVEVFRRRAEHGGRLVMGGEGVDEAHGAVHGGDSQLAARRCLDALQVLSVGVDGSVAGGRSLLVSRVVVCRALILHGGFGKVAVFELQIGKLVVGGRGVVVGGEGCQQLPVPGERLGVVPGPLLFELFHLVEGVIVAGEVLEVRLQVAQDVGRLLDLRVLPVLGVEAVATGEVFLGFHYQLAEIALGVNLHHAHAEMGRDPVEGMQLSEGTIDLGRVVVAQLAQEELAEVAVDPVFVAAVAVGGVILVDDLRSAQVGEGQAHHAEGVRHAAVIVLVGLGFPGGVGGRHVDGRDRGARLPVEIAILGGLFIAGPVGIRCLLGQHPVEVVAHGLLVVQERHEPVQGFLVEVLLVERPAQLVQSQLVELRAGTDGDHGRVGLFGLQILLPHEEVLGAAEVHLVSVVRVAVVVDEPVHDLHGLVRLAKLVVGPRHLVENLIVALVVRVAVEDLLIGGDCFQRACGGCCRQPVGQTSLGRTRPVCGRQRQRRGRAALEFRFRLGVIGDGGITFGAGAHRILHRQTRGCGERHAAAVADDAVFFLDLQIRKAPHRVRRLVVDGRLVEKVPVAGQRLVEAVVDGHLGHVGLHAAQLLDGLSAIGAARATGEQRKEQHGGQNDGHHGSSAYCAWVARS